VLHNAARLLKRLPSADVITDITAAGVAAPAAAPDLSHIQNAIKPRTN